MSMMKSLKERTQEFNTVLPFMEGKDKGDLKGLFGQAVTINDYGFMDGDDGEYVCFTIKEDAKRFYFGGMVLTDNMKQLEGEGYGEEIRKSGLPVLFGEKMGKNKRTYTTVDFFPEV